MCASFYPSVPVVPSHAHAASGTAQIAGSPSSYFFSFSPEVFSRAVSQRVPVFLVIGEISSAFLDPSVSAHLTERTIPAHLFPGQRPDVELLCRRAAALYSDEGTLPLCALLLENGLPFLAAPLSPQGFHIDPSRLFIWLTYADRRFMQNRSAFTSQAQNVLRSFSASPMLKPYTPKDASHDLLRAILSVQDRVNGGFGRIKSPHVPLLRFLSREGTRGSRDARDALEAALRAMRFGALHDPVDGLYFSATLTEDWRIFIPEKPLAINALIATTLMENAERSDAIRILDALTSHFSLAGGGYAPALHASRSRYTFSPEQVCALLGNEEGLRACRLLSLLNQHRKSDPPVAPSRFSPPPSKKRISLDAPKTPLTPILPADPVAEDAAFLRRALPVLLRGRAARESETPSSPMLVMDCALAASVFFSLGQRLGEARYVQSAHHAIHTLLSFIPDIMHPGSLPPACSPAAPQSPPVCGAAAALSLALLILAENDPGSALAAAGLRLLGSTLHAFVREDGMVMHTPPSQTDFFPRVPAIFDNELPSPAALIVHALKRAQKLRPDTPYTEAIDTIFSAAAPYMKHEPLACASLIDAVTTESGIP